MSLTNVTKHKRFRSDRLAPYFFILPFYIIFMVFSFLPIVSAFGISFTDWKGVKGGNWIGLRNYDLLLNDPSFWQALSNTLLVWIVVMPLLTFGGLILAVVLNQKWVQGRYFFRLAIFSPVVLSLVVAGLVFLLILDPDFGPLAVVLQLFGLDPINITADEWAAVPAISMITLWRWLGWNMIIMLAGLQTINQDIMEAAIVDGAGSVQRFLYIILPMIRPVIVFAAVLSTIGIFNLFDEPFVLFGKQGGPGQAGLMMGPYIYRTAFEFFNFGYASAIAYVVAGLVFIASLTQYRFSNSRS